MQRSAGVLVPVSSIVSNYGVGDFGSYAYQLIDYLKEMNMKIWQILPLNPLGYGNSPYQPYSSYAGDEIYISLEKLYEDGLLAKLPAKFNASNDFVEYEKVRAYKKKYLKEAYENFKDVEVLRTFIKENDWAYSYAIFLTFKKANDLKCWVDWPKEMRDYPLTGKMNLENYNKDILYEIFLQYIFKKQWMNLKTYANKKGLKIMGDIPIYVGLDSQDVWENRGIFELDKDGRPTYVAGVPPDYFSATGQRWGNPIYNWEKLEQDDFKFWHERLNYNSELFDIIRIDHFRAFDTYYKIPASCDTAIEGEWVEAPGYKLFDSIFRENKIIEIVVEDLGELREEVHQLRDHYNFAGMKIVQFTLDPNETNNDFDDKKNMIIYTGTHDNDTLLGWLDKQSFDQTIDLVKYFKTSFVHEKIIELTFKSIANYAIVPIQDILRLDNNSRMNTPGSVGSPNWEYKMVDFSGLEERINYYKKLVKKTKRK